MVRIPGGSFRPFDLLKEDKAVKIKSFLIDRYPVSTAEYAAFVAANPAWAKGNAPPIKADQGYLKSVSLSPASEKTVMTQVSWYAARAYCAAQGKRLPALNEWEYGGDLQQMGSAL
jgi:formylglycine-generating enzyme required for sulfatase activity